jgi:hypothetical protein
LGLIGLVFLLTGMIGLIEIKNTLPTKTAGEASQLGCKLGYQRG